MDPHFQFACGALTLLGCKSHMLPNIPLVRRHKPPGLVRGPFHAANLPNRGMPTTSKWQATGSHHPDLINSFRVRGLQSRQSG